MKKIPLTKGQVALVSDEDFEALNRHKWCAGWSECNQSFYAKRADRGSDGKRRALLLHRHILLNITANFHERFNKREKRCFD